VKFVDSITLLVKHRDNFTMLHYFPLMYLSHMDF